MKCFVGVAELYDGATTDGPPAAASANFLLAPAGRIHDGNVPVEHAASRKVARVVLVRLDDSGASIAQRRLRRAQEFSHGRRVHCARTT